MNPLMNPLGLMNPLLPPTTTTTPHTPHPRRSYGKEADVFSLGVLLWELVTLKEPWREETEGRTALYYIINSVVDGKRLELPDPAAAEPPLPELPRCALAVVRWWWW